jgi:hypothetical protein
MTTLTLYRDIHPYTYTHIVYNFDEDKGLDNMKATRWQIMPTNLSASATDNTDTSTHAYHATEVSDI